MRDKLDDCVGMGPPPPQSAGPVGALTLTIPRPHETSAFIKRKKPHTLPPLDFRPLEGRGSPVPQRRRRSSIEEQLLQAEGQVQVQIVPGDGRPKIMLTTPEGPEDGADAEQLHTPSSAGGPGLDGPLSVPLPKRGPPSSTPTSETLPPHSLSPLSSRYAPLQPIKRTLTHSSGTPDEENGNRVP